MIMKNTLLSFLLLIGFSSFSQPFNDKYGNISMAEMEMKVCSIDSSADAVVLFDTGESRMLYNASIKDFQLEFTRHFRIKILKKKGLKFGTFEVPLYRNRGSKDKESSFKDVAIFLPEGNSSGAAQEKITLIKGATYNLVNGKVEKVKLDKGLIYIEDNNDNSLVNKISFSNVEVGSVVECRYTILTDFIFNLQPWCFQSTIPVLHSRYDTYLFDYYNCKGHISGFEPVQTGKSNSINKYFTFLWQESGERGIKKDYFINYNYYEISKSYEAHNLPALKVDDFTDNVLNYSSRIDFEFIYLVIPRVPIKANFSSWESVNKRIIESADFGKQLNNGDYMKTDLQKSIEGINAPEEKLAKVRSFVLEKIKWNNKYGVYIEKGAMVAYKEGLGNVADINLNLVIALKQAGLDAYPLILSTRSHGGLFDWNKHINGFNYVVAAVKINDKIILCDATSKFSYPGTIPLECLNGQALIVDSEKTERVDLYPKKISKKSSYSLFEIDDKLKLKGSVTTVYKDYFAFQLMESVNREDGLKNRKAEITKLYSDCLIDSLIVILNGNSLLDAKESYNVSRGVLFSGSDSLISINPSQSLGLEFFLTASIDRKYPLNITFPREESYVIKVAVPKGYKVNKAPLSVNFSLPDGNGKYMYNCQVSDNEVVIVCKVQFSKVEYGSAEYPALKVLMDEIAKKQREIIIFKKK